MKIAMHAGLKILHLPCCESVAAFHQNFEASTNVPSGDKKPMTIKIHPRT
jgi:hypothetical protein